MEKYIGDSQQCYHGRFFLGTVKLIIIIFSRNSIIRTCQCFRFDSSKVLQSLLGKICSTSLEPLKAVVFLIVGNRRCCLRVVDPLWIKFRSLGIPKCHQVLELLSKRLETIEPSGSVMGLRENFKAEIAVLAQWPCSEAQFPWFYSTFLRMHWHSQNLRKDLHQIGK